MDGPLKCPASLIILLPRGRPGLTELLPFTAARQPRETTPRRPVALAYLRRGRMAFPVMN